MSFLHRPSPHADGVRKARKSASNSSSAGGTSPLSVQALLQPGLKHIQPWRYTCGLVCSHEEHFSFFGSVAQLRLCKGSGLGEPLAAHQLLLEMSIFSKRSLAPDFPANDSHHTCVMRKKSITLYLCGTFALSKVLRSPTSRLAEFLTGCDAD